MNKILQKQCGLTIVYNQIEEYKKIDKEFQGLDEVESKEL